MLYCLGYGVFLKMPENKVFSKKCSCEKYFGKHILNFDYVNYGLKIDANLINIPIKHHLKNTSKFIIMHGNVIIYKKKHILIIGKSGIGKSSFTYYAVKKDKNIKFVADDTVFISKDDYKIYPCKCRPFLKRKGSNESYIPINQIFYNKIDCEPSYIDKIIYFDDHYLHKSLKKVEKYKKLNILIRNMWNPSINSLDVFSEIPLFVFNPQKYSKGLLLKNIKKGEYEKSKYFRCLF